jgi:hypothetical protein
VSIKYEIRKLPDGGSRAALSGKIDEHFDGRTLMDAIGPARRVVLELSGVRAVTSLGIREFEKLLRGLDGRELTLDQVSAALATQLMLIPTLLGAHCVTSARLPFVCPSCAQETTHVVPYEAGAAALHPPSCPECGDQMELDGMAEEYLPH